MAIPSDIKQQVYDLLSRASNISFVTADQEPAGRGGYSPGQRVRAEVLTTLPNNLTQVRVGSDHFNLDLPMQVRPGQSLEMTFVSNEPRSTFAIARPGGGAPPVSLSDASRLLSLLVNNEQIQEPGIRSSLQSIGEMLRRSPGDSGVLSNLLDEVLTYSAPREGGTGVPQAAADSMKRPGLPPGAGSWQETPLFAQEQSRLAAFESNATQMLKNIAQNSRFALMEAANQPVTPLPLTPGEEVSATVVGLLPGGRAIVQVAGSTLELPVQKTVQPADILRLTYISSDPKPVFAMPRLQPDAPPASLSDAGRWLSQLEHTPGGVSPQQMYVLERLNTVLKSLPPDSPAFTAILDEAVTYQPVIRGGENPVISSEAQASLLASQLPTYSAGSEIVLNDDMTKLLQALIRGNRLALLEALNQQAMPTGLMPGQQLKGEVLSALGGGRFMVLVAGQVLEFIMPKGIRRGDRLNLFFITEEPAGTFLMARFGRISDSQVSETGRWLSAFIGSPSEQVSAGGVLNLLRTLLSSPPSDASQLSSSMQQGVRESGLFYESHLARWFGGKYALEELLKEPQGRLSALMEGVLKRGGTASAHEGIADQRTLPVVAEQLSALQSGQLLFRGDLFPGQHLEWTLAERDAEGDQSGKRERSWETTLNIDLPLLGAVGVRLQIDGVRVSMDIRAEDTETVTFLETGRSVLTEQLEAARLTPVGIVMQNADS